MEKDEKTEVKKTKNQITSYYATGKRKTAIARVWLKTGKGNIVINNQKLEEMNLSDTQKQRLTIPLELTSTTSRFDVNATVKGGGTSGQVDAVLYGLAKALNTISDEYRKVLKTEGLLKRDARIVERKHYGKRKARKGATYRKR